MTRRAAAGVAATLLAAAGILTGCSSSADSFVERDGRQLVVDGQPFGFVGFNMYDAAATDTYSCKPESRLSDEQLVETLRSLKETSGTTVLRFWAYQTYTDGGRDWSGVDRVIAAAKEVGIRVMPVLEDGPGDCSTGEAGVALDQLPGDTWYTESYREPYGSARLSLVDYAREIAGHYADEPTIVAWTLMNEAETSARDEQGRSALVGFTREVAAAVRSADENHLITLGTQGNGAPGASGPDYREVYGLSELDFAEVHDWPRNGSSDDEALAGLDGDGSLPDPRSGACTSTTAPIACSLAVAAELDKPVVVGEAGIEARDDQARQRRAKIFERKIYKAWDLGVSGYLVWHYHEVPTDGYDVVPGTDDPLLGIMAEAAGGAPGA